MLWLRSAVAIVIGYATMVAGAWYAQEGLFPGVKWGSPFPDLLALGLCTSVLAAFGGAVTALLAPRRPYIHLLPMAALISAETIYLYVIGKVHGPLWFELLAGASLVAGTFIAAFIALAVKGSLGRSWDHSQA